MHCFHFIIKSLNEGVGGSKIKSRNIFHLSCLGKFFHYRNVDKLEGADTWAEGDICSYISLLLSLFLIRYFLSAFTCDVPDPFLFVFQMFNRGTQWHNEAPEKVLTVCFMSVKSHNYSYLLKKPFPAHSPRFFFILHDLCESLHFGQAHGGLRFSSNANCSLWLSAHNVIFFLPLSAFGGECRRPQCEEWTQKSFTAVSNEASYPTDETVMDEMSLPHSPLCTLITSPISHMSKTKEVEFLQKDNDFHYWGQIRSHQLLVEGSESGAE